MRLKRQLHLRAFAERVGVPASTISRIESGAMDPTYSMLQRIASGAGYTLADDLAESGSDEPFARGLEELGQAAGAQRSRLMGKLAAVASLAPVAKRSGARIFGLNQSVAELVRELADKGQRPVVSSFEALSGDLTTTRSFTPVIYVEHPESLDDLPARSPASRASVIILPKTENVRKFVRRAHDVDVMMPEWGLLDAIASPGRQSDTAIAYLRQLNGTPA